MADSGFGLCSAMVAYTCLLGVVRTVMSYMFASPCFCEMQLQIARHLIPVGSRWHSVANGVAVFLRNAVAGFQPFYCGFKVALGCQWRRCASGKCNCRLLDALYWWAQRQWAIGCRLLDAL